jgi:HTH-type transcriptional regulator/antitoxin HigA
MELSLIRTKNQYKTMIAWAERQLDRSVPADSPTGRKLEVALLLIKKYEDEHHTIPRPDPIDLIRLRMQERGMKSKDLVGLVGSKGYVSQILNRRKPLTLGLARIFHKLLDIPADVLLK